MRPFDQLLPRQQVFRKNATRLVIYSIFTHILIWSIIKMIEVQDEKQAQYSRIEDTLMAYYKETKQQPDTVGMADYMRKQLSPVDFNAWKN